jgi:hypothetical protein
MGSGQLGASRTKETGTDDLETNTHNNGAFCPDFVRNSDGEGETLIPRNNANSSDLMDEDERSRNIERDFDLALQWHFADQLESSLFSAGTLRIPSFARSGSIQKPDKKAPDFSAWDDEPWLSATSSDKLHKLVEEISRCVNREDDGELLQMGLAICNMVQGETVDSDLVAQEIVSACKGNWSSPAEPSVIAGPPTSLRFVNFMQTALAEAGVGRADYHAGKGLPSGKSGEGGLQPPDVIFKEEISIKKRRVNWIVCASKLIIPGLSDSQEATRHAERMKELTGEFGPGAVLWEKGFCETIASGEVANFTCSLDVNTAMKKALKRGGSM